MICKDNTVARVQKLWLPDVLVKFRSLRGSPRTTTSEG